MRRPSALVFLAAMIGPILTGCEESQLMLETTPPTGFNALVAENELNADLAVSGSKIVADGVGLQGVSDGTINIDIPTGAIVRVLLYWEVIDPDGTPDQVQLTKGAVTTTVTGDLIGESTHSESYRADLTGEGLGFSTGLNSLLVDPLGDFDVNGASLLVVIDDGTDAVIDIRDGDDVAWLGFPPASPDHGTVPQTFTFAPEASDRDADLWLIAGDVEDSRPNRIEITVDGTTTSLINELGDGGPGRDGAEWDTYNRTVTIPAGATELTVQLFSFDDETALVPASLVWVVAGLALPVSPAGGQGCTPGYWKQSHHFDSWPAPYTPTTPFSDVFEDAFPGMTLLEVLQQGGGGLKALGRHTVAALLNAASPGVSYDLTTQDVIDAFNDVFPGSKQDYNTLKGEFEGFNEQGCPLN